MLETIREYGLECLAEKGELEAARQAHAQCILALAEEAAPHLKTLQEVGWLQRLERDMDNFRRGSPSTRCCSPGSIPPRSVTQSQRVSLRKALPSRAITTMSKRCRIVSWDSPTWLWHRSSTCEPSASWAQMRRCVKPPGFPSIRSSVPPMIAVSSMFAPSLGEKLLLPCWPKDAPCRSAKPLSPAMSRQGTILPLKLPLYRSLPTPLD